MWNNSLKTKRKLAGRPCITNGVTNMCPKFVKKGGEEIRLGPETPEKDTEEEKNTMGSEVLQCKHIQTV